jgi:hypothetical protein
MSGDEPKHPEFLNEFQANRLRITCQYIDDLLGDIERILDTVESKAAFPRYSCDITLDQRQTIDDYIARIRKQLARALKGHGISTEKPSIPASRAIHVTLGAIDIAAEELKPRYMLGYGAVPEGAAAELNGIAGELQSLVNQLDRCLTGGIGENLTTRVEQVDHPRSDSGGS